MALPPESSHQGAKASAAAASVPGRAHFVPIDSAGQRADRQAEAEEVESAASLRAANDLTEEVHEALRRQSAN